MDFFPVQDENDPYAMNLLNAYGTVEYRVRTNTEKDTKFWTLSKPLSDGGSEHQLIAEVEYSKWGAPTEVTNEVGGDHCRRCGRISSFALSATTEPVWLDGGIRDGSYRPLRL
jgi:hypothetical protein